MTASSTDKVDGQKLPRGLENRSALTRRIGRQDRNYDQWASQNLTPISQPGQTGTAVPHPEQDMTMPLTVVEMTASGQQVSSAVPLYAGPRGAPVPATAPGQWQQVHAVGRP